MKPWSCSVLVSLSALAGLAHTQDPGNNNCRTNAECKVEFCDDVILACIAPMPGGSTPVQPLTPEQRAVFDNCIRAQLAVHQVCVNRICVTGYNEAQVAPTSESCRQQWVTEDGGCRSGSSFCNEDYEPDIHPEVRDAIRTACAEAALMRYQRCRFHAQSTSPQGLYAFEEEAIYNEVFSQRLYVPAEGEDVASMVWVPQGEGSELVDGMSYTVLIPTLDGESIVLDSGMIPAAADGLFEVALNLNELPGSIGVSRISVMVDWLDAEGEYLWNAPFLFTIAESGIPGDFDRDGERNAADLGAFIDAYDHNAPRADRNGDGVVNATDLELFLAEYDAG
ncbi:MAG: GC-type dockerin domain-anchored protein [Phycisphaerales bacterium]